MTSPSKARLALALILTCSLLTLAAPSRAQEATVVTDAERTYTIDAIIVEGLDRTKREVVIRELLFDEGQQATTSEIEESVQRLRNLGLFRIAEYELLDRRVPLPEGAPQLEDEGDHRVLKITVDERWTLLPYGQFTRGGGTFSLTAGIFDVNVFGRFLEAGLQYQRFGDTNSWLFWAADPRFLDLRLVTSVTAGWTNRVNVLYDDAGEVEGGHLRFRRVVRFAANREWRKWLRTGAQLSFILDEFSLEMVPEVIAQQEALRGIPDPSRMLVFHGSTGLGRIDANSYLRQGLRFGLGISHANRHLGSTLSFTDVATDLKWFQMLPLKSNLGVRLGVGISDVQQEHYEFFVGGYNLLRGFLHRRFRGQHYWFSNVEFRVPSIDTRWLVLQHVGFVDAAGVTDDFSDFATLSGASAGIGLRIISPKIYSFVARIDYAFPLVGSGRAPLSFGAGQFF